MNAELDSIVETIETEANYVLNDVEDTGQKTRKTIKRSLIKEAFSRGQGAYSKAAKVITITSQSKKAGK